MNSIHKVVVTGSSGKAGRAVVKDLAEHGYKVLGVNLLKPTEPAKGTRYLQADLTDLGQTAEVLLAEVSDLAVMRRLLQKA